MPKLDVGVGDEFPAKEVKNEAPSGDEEQTVHHHHYYRGRDRSYRYYYRRRGRFWWFVLWILVVSAVFRSFDMMAGAWGWAWDSWGGPWGSWNHWMWGPFHALQGTLMTILIIGGFIVIAQWRNREEEREDRDEDRR